MMKLILIFKLNFVSKGTQTSSSGNYIWKQMPKNIHRQNRHIILGACDSCRNYRYIHILPYAFIWCDAYL